MLILTRRRDEAVMIGDDVIFRVSEVDEKLGQVKISIDAPAGIVVHSREAAAPSQDTEAGVVITHKRRARR